VMKAVNTASRLYWWGNTYFHALEKTCFHALGRVRAYLGTDVPVDVLIIIMGVMIALAQHISNGNGSAACWEWLLWLDELKECLGM
jgi:hypothetical protein